MARGRIITVVNKWWECDPIMFVLLNANAVPAGFPWPSVLFHPHKRPDPSNLPSFVAAAPRAVFQLANFNVELWCISDLLDDLSAQYQSSTEKKAARLSLIFDGLQPSLVIAVGTAAFPSLNTENGNVVVGTRVFLHDGHPPGTPQNPVSKWHAGPFNEVLDSSLDSNTFDAIVSSAQKTLPAFQDLLLKPPLNPSAGSSLIAKYKGVSLGSLNVTDPSEYQQQDQATLDSFRSISSDPATAISLDTTLGLVRVQEEAATFLFVAGIVNRVGFAATEMIPRNYAQNFAGAHNAGIVLARLLLAADCALTYPGQP
jgi:hypothetical protein